MPNKDIINPFPDDDYEDENCNSENCVACESYDDCPNGIHFDWDDDDFEDLTQN